MPKTTAQPDWLDNAAREAREVIERLHAEARAAMDAIDEPPVPAPESGS